MDLAHVWYDDRYKSKILCGTIYTPVHDFKVKVTDLDFLCHSFRTHYFQTLWWIWFTCGIMMDIGQNSIPTPVYDLKVKATDLEFCMLKF